MSEREALLAAILSEPDEDAHRLIFADWLEENAEPDRGEFIRLDVELARTPPGSAEDELRRKWILNRRDQLLKARGSEWLEPFLPYARSSSFHRGFVDSLEVPAHTFLQRAESWFSAAPVSKVKFTTFTAWDDPVQNFASWTVPLFGSGLLAKLKVVELEQCHLSASDIVRFSQSSDLSRLKELNLARNDIRTEGAIALAGMKQLGGLESLDLVGNGISDSGARAIAQSPYLGGLKELRMCRNQFRKKSWTMLELRFGMALMG